MERYQKLLRKTKQALFFAAFAWQIASCSSPNPNIFKQTPVPQQNHQVITGFARPQPMVLPPVPTTAPTTEVPTQDLSSPTETAPTAETIVEGPTIQTVEAVAQPEGISYTRPEINGVRVHMFEMDPSKFDFRTVSANGVDQGWGADRELLFNAYNRLERSGQTPILLINGDFFGNAGPEGFTVINGYIKNEGGGRVSFNVWKDGRITIEEVDLAEKHNLLYAIGGGPKLMFMDKLDGQVKIASARDDVLQEGEVAFDILAKKGFSLDDPYQAPTRKSHYREPYSQQIIALKLDPTGRVESIAIVTADQYIAGIDVIRDLKNRGYQFAMNFDNGGSTKAMYLGRPVVIMTENGEERAVGNYLGVFPR